MNKKVIQFDTSKENILFYKETLAGSDQLARDKVLRFLEHEPELFKYLFDDLINVLNTTDTTFQNVKLAETILFNNLTINEKDKLIAKIKSIKDLSNNICLVSKCLVLLGKMMQRRNKEIIFGHSFLNWIHRDIVFLAKDKLYCSFNQIRESALELLGLIGKQAKPALNLVYAILENENEAIEIRIKAAKTIGLIGARYGSSLRILGKNINHENSALRAAVIESLNAFGLRGTRYLEHLTG